MLIKWLTFLTLGLLLAGCSGNAATTTWQRQQVSSSGQYQATLTCATAPAVAIFQECSLQLRSEQALPPDLTLAVDGGMPSHGHGLPTAPQAIPTDKAGEFRIDGLKYSMTGEWVLGFWLHSAAGQDKIVFQFTINDNTAWTAQERATLQSLNLASLPAAHDPSNRFADNPQAAALGKQLFFDPRFSRNGQVACATCHLPNKAFSDGKPVAEAFATGTRNTPSLLGVAHNDWFFWDGRKDSLWSQALAPLENPAEHGFTRVAAVRLLLNDTAYNAQYRALLTNLPTAATLATLPASASPSGTLEQLQAWKNIPQAEREQVDQVFAATGKFIAAYVSSLALPPNRLDAAISNSSALTPTEMAGARLFMGKAQCLLCHSGAMLTNQTFQNSGTGTLGVDSGRAAALDSVRNDRFNCQGKHSDAPPETCTELQFLTRNRHSVAGAFKVPSLRNVAQTAPYFHDGRMATLEAVVDYYVHASQQANKDHDLPRIELSDAEKQALVAFLKVL
jgi:cytochrome c peroxidase